MPLTTTNVGNNPATPGIAAEIYKPDQLIAGQFPNVTQPITIASGQGVLPRGQVLGQVTASGKYIKAVSTAVDGSQTPVCILVDAVDATSADQAAGGYFSGEFNVGAMTYDASFTITTLTNVLRDASIFLKVVSAALSNADPT
jgi:hypothetical protein